jgi:general secretion pathway protein A
MNPFSTSPLPQYLHLTDSLRATLSKIKYVIDNRQGLTVVYGDVGTGKSSLMRRLYSDYLDRTDVMIGFLPTPRYKTDVALLRAIAGEFGLPVRRSMQDQENDLRQHLVEQFVAKGTNAVVLIDEAQIIPGSVLELIRLLMNLETDEAKLVQIVLAGQLELRDRLKDNSKRALRRRIFITSTLDPMTLEEAREMIGHRAQLSGVAVPFPEDRIERIWSWARGIPGEMLKVCAASYDLAKGRGLENVPIEAVEACILDMPVLDEVEA